MGGGGIKDDIRKLPITHENIELKVRVEIWCKKLYNLAFLLNDMQHT
jgi:hypothetical protein